MELNALAGLDLKMSNLTDEFVNALQKKRIV